MIGIYFSFVREASTSPSEACPTAHRCKLHHFGRSPRLLYSIYKAQTCAPKKSPRRRHKHTRLQCVHVEDQMLRQACDCQLPLLESMIWNDMTRKCVWMRLIQTCPPDHTIMPPGICPAAPLNGERPEQDALWYIKIMKFQCTVLYTMRLCHGIRSSCLCSESLFLVLVWVPLEDEILHTRRRTLDKVRAN